MTAITETQNVQREIRKRGRSARAAMPTPAREIASRIIAEKVVREPWFRVAGNVACYLSTADEVDTWQLVARAWEMKKRIFAPIAKKNGRMEFHRISAESRLEVSDFGLYEPASGETISVRELDIVLTPLVAFDDKRHRVGMGGGYFDRSFSFLRHREKYFHPKLIGLAFACQEVEKIPANPWDIRLFDVLTEARD